MLIGTVAAITALLALSLLELKRWNAARDIAHRRHDDLYFVPAAIVYPLFAILAIGSIALVCVGARQGDSQHGWAYYMSAILCAGLCQAGSAETRRTFVRFDGEEVIFQSLARSRRFRISEVERVMTMRGAIVIWLRSGRVSLASNVLGWNAALRTRLASMNLQWRRSAESRGTSDRASCNALAADGGRRDDS
jgi:hypothetical protein